MSRVLVSVAWPYANGPRHIGHVAGFGVPADVYARYMRMAGHEVLMVSGTDEHGTPIQVQADAEGVTPRELVDRYNRVIVNDLAALGLSYDLFTRTTTANHYQVTQQMFTALYEHGFIVEKTTTGAVSPSTGRGLPDRYIEGTCPFCGYESARGDQCDNCGRQLDPVDLINPRSKVDGATPLFVETQHLFLDLPSFAAPLRAWISEQEHWRPNVKAFSLNLVDELHPRAITRDLEWGVPIPAPFAGDPAWENKRLYVWFDAVIGYLSASIEWAARTGQAWEPFWQRSSDGGAEGEYFMGKDNVVFHSVIWPSMLLGQNSPEPGPFGVLDLPHEVVSSEFLTMEGKKFSSSRGIVIYVRDMLSRYQPDALRYYLAVAGPESSDTDFTWAEFLRRTNDELVAAWGNLVNRTLSMAAKQVGSIPVAGELEQIDVEALAASEKAFGTVGALIEEHRQKAAISEVMRVVGEANKYLADTAPWKLKEDSPEVRARRDTVLHVALQLVSDARVLLTPFLPFSSEQVDVALGGGGGWSGFPAVVEGPEGPVLMTQASRARWARVPLPVGHPLEAPTPIFTKLEPSIVEEELERAGLTP